MALKQPIKTTTNATAQSADTAAALHLPPPQTFDILPPLYELLARVDKHQSGTNLPGEPTEGYHFIEGASGDIGAAYSKSGALEHQQPLNPKDLPTAALEIKGLIRNALREVEKLPDVDRSVEEQEEEIAELEERVKRQREMLRGLAEVAKGMEGRLGG